MTQSHSDAHYLLDRDELSRIRGLRLLASARDYVSFALQMNYPGKLNPAINVVAFCAPEGISYAACWELDEGGSVQSVRRAAEEGHCRVDFELAEASTLLNKAIAPCMIGFLRGTAAHQNSKI
jgi:hypothetical protein